MLKVLRYLTPYWPRVLLIFALLFGQAMFDLALPDYMASIVSQGIAVSDLSVIWNKGWQMLLLSLGGMALSVTVGLLAAQVGARMAQDLRARLFTHITDFSGAEFDRFSPSSLITRSTNDITQLQMFAVIMLRLFFYAPVMGVGGVIKAAQKSQGMGSMTLVIAAAVGALLCMILILFIVVQPRFKRIQKLIDRMNLVAREGLNGIMVVRAFNNQPYEEKRFSDVNTQLTRVNLTVNRIMALLFPFMMLVMYSVSISVVWIASYQAKDMVQVGNMMAFIQYAMQIIMSFLMLSMMFIFFPRAAVSADRVHQVLSTPLSVKNPEHPAAPPASGLVEFKNVSFRYPGAAEDVLTDISFTARPGTITAIIGSTGSGKSTLVSLLPRLYDVTKGEVLLGGEDIRHFSLKDLRQAIGFVPQKSVLFSGDIAWNLRMGAPEAPQEVLEKAAGIAQAAEIIESKPDKWQEPIAQGGQNVSGGQKQRLAIARALVKQAPVLVFDDSFSALDFTTDARLRQALKRETGGATVLLIGQRVGSIRNADQILVLENGKIVGQGTHKELLESCPVYLDIAQSQLSGEELA